MASYISERSITWGALVSPTLVTGQTIVAGSFSATYELACCILTLLIEAEEAFPMATFSLHVDDLPMARAGETEREVVEDMGAMGEFMI